VVVGAWLPIECEDLFIRRSSGKLDGVAVGAAAGLSVECERVCTNRRYRRARGGGAVVEGSTCALTGAE